ncbi:hypothetical protein EDB84DRAFT_1440933 [Lactarius hengduanensis]|nr:hypothetical protein EDB84DRAFT_1440933 [Lactarius hengduanensis]
MSMGILYTVERGSLELTLVTLDRDEAYGEGFDALYFSAHDGEPAKDYCEQRGCCQAILSKTRPASHRMVQFPTFSLHRPTRISSHTLHYLHFVGIPGLEQHMTCRVPLPLSLAAFHGSRGALERLVLVLAPDVGVHACGQLLAILGARLELLELSLDGASDEAFHMLRLWATLVTEGAKAEEDRSTLYGYGLRLHRHHRIARVSSYYHPDGNTPSFFVEHEHEPNSLPSARLLDQPGRAHQAGGGLVLPLWRTPLTTQCMGRCTWWRKLLAIRVTRVWAQTPSSRFRDSRHGGDWAERISGQVAVMSCATKIVCILDLRGGVGRFGSVEPTLQLPRMSRLRRHGVHLPMRVSIIAILKGDLSREANFGTLERVDDAAFADVQKPTGPTAMSGPDTWRRRRCTGACCRGEIRALVGAVWRESEALTSWCRGASGVPTHSRVYPINREGREGGMETAGRHVPILLARIESLSLRLAFVLLLLHLRPSVPDRENLRHSESERKLLAMRATRAPAQVSSSYFLAMGTKQNDLARTERRRRFSSLRSNRGTAGPSLVSAPERYEYIVLLDDGWVNTPFKG